jgi:hypothetical protein
MIEATLIAKPAEADAAAKALAIPDPSTLL